MSASFHLFVYGTLRRNGATPGILGDSEWVGPATVAGTLYDIEGRHPALVLYGTTPVRGEIWRCPADLLPRLDAYERLDDGLFRRIGVEVEGTPCWAYVAGPALARRLAPDRRIHGGDWLEHARAR